MNKFIYALAFFLAVSFGYGAHTVNLKLVPIGQGADDVSVDLIFLDGSGEFLTSGINVSPGNNYTHLYSQSSPFVIVVTFHSAAVDVSGASLVANSEGAGNYGVDSGGFAGYFNSTTDGVPPLRTLGVGLQELQTDGTKPIWTDGSSTLTGALFREGIDKIAGAVGSSSSGSSTGTTSSGNTTQSELLATQQNALFSASEYSGNPTNAAQASAGATAANTVKALLPSAPTGLGYTLAEPGDLPTIGDAGSPLALVMPASFGGQTFDFNPFTESRLGPVMTWFRTALAWLVLIQLGIFISKEMGVWTRGLSFSPQAKGNTIAAGSGGQATSFFAAVAITAAIVVGVTALVAYAFGSIDLVAILSAMTTNPLATAPLGMFELLNKVFPLTVIISALVARVSFHLFAAKLFAGVSTVVRYITP